MNKQGHLYPNYFLNRIAANYSGDPTKADPFLVLKSFFDYAERADQIKAFDSYCLAALKEGYSWERGSPANALYYGEQLELLVEATYLIHQHAGQLQWQPSAAIVVPLTELPMLLTSNEFTHPVSFLVQFFAREPLHQWKQLLHMFTSAALSNSSVADEVEAADIIAFIHYLKKLVYAASRLVVLQAGDDKS